MCMGVEGMKTQTENLRSSSKNESKKLSRFEIRDIVLEWAEQEHLPYIPLADLEDLIKRLEGGK